MGDKTSKIKYKGQGVEIYSLLKSFKKKVKIMDNFKVIYKILKELEKSMGNENFQIENISSEKLKIPFEKWEQLLILMQDEGYIKGLVLTNEIGQMYKHIAEPKKPQITLKGLEYLADNSLMSKAKEAFKLAGEII